MLSTLQSCQNNRTCFVFRFYSRTKIVFSKISTFLFYILTIPGPQTPEDLSKYVIIDQNVKQYHCGLCDSFKAKLPSKVKNHVEAIHFPGLFVYSCEICQITCKGKNALNVHKSKRHNVKTKSYN